MRTHVCSFAFLWLLFNFHTHICNALPSQEKQGLVDLYHAANGENWRRNDNWLKGDPCENWYGVTCNKDGRVTQFSLYDNLLVGTVPASITSLTEVEYFALSTNKLTGPLPEKLGSTFTKCRYFDLRYNFFNGTLPVDSLSAMVHLDHLVLSNNLFTGQGINRIITTMRNLTYFDVRSNRFSDKAPAAVCDLENLTYCGLADKYHTNDFTDVTPCIEKRFCGYANPFVAFNPHVSHSTYSQVPPVTQCGRRNLTEHS